MHGCILHDGKYIHRGGNVVNDLSYEAKIFIILSHLIQTVHFHTFQKELSLQEVLIYLSQRMHNLKKETEFSNIMQ